MIWEIAQWSYRGYAMGIHPTSPIPENAQYRAMLLTRLRIIRETRIQNPNTKKQMDFVEAELLVPWGANVTVSASHFERPTDCDADEIRPWRLHHVLTWFCGGRHRVFAADMNWANKDSRVGDIFPRSAGVADLWKRQNPDKPGYTYNGVINMNAKPVFLGRLGRILGSPRMTDLSRTTTLVGSVSLKKLRAGFAHGAKSSPVHPSEHFGLLADFSMTSPKEPTARIAPQPKASPYPLPPGRLPQQEAEEIPLRNFAPRSVSSQNLRDAIATLGAALPVDKSGASTLGMFGIAPPYEVDMDHRLYSEDLKRRRANTKTYLKREQNPTYREGI